jgi:hypothetical protein
MKKLVLLIVLMLILLSAYSQNYITFDNSQGLFRIRIDTTIPNNKWQIGKPQKAHFTSAYSLPNAIVTDTIATYPLNNTSVFYLGTGGDWSKNPNSHAVILDFHYRMDSDSLLDFGKIELSLDIGQTWMNVAKQGNFWVYDNNGNIKEEAGQGDTIVFTGWTNGWFEFHHVYSNIPWGVVIDTVIYKFTFHSDNTVSNRDGWIIDNLSFFDTMESIFEKSNTYTCYPDPVIDMFHMDTKLLQKEIEIYNSQGIKLTKTLLNNHNSDIDVSNLQPGLYYYRVNLEDSTIINGKFIKTK